MTDIPVTLGATAAAAIITMWLGMRTGSMRGKTKILHGDGGNAALTRRMRAQLNFVEYTPFVIALIAAIELSGRGGVWLSIVAAIYFLARILHAIGMDAENVPRTRMIGIMVTMLTLLGLAVYAVLILAGVL